MRRYIHNHHPGIVDVNNCGACHDNIIAANLGPDVFDRIEPPDDRDARDNGHIIPIDRGPFVEYAINHFGLRPDDVFQHLDA